jgi:magnesium transporter
MTLTCRLYRHGRLEDEHLEATRIDEVLREPATMVWLDVQDPTQETMDMLGEEFGFHELALEDALHPHQRPKIEQYGSYFFLVAYGVTLQGTDLTEHELAAFVGRNYLVTVRKDPVFDLASVVERWDTHSDLAKEGGGYLLYILLDEIVDGYFDCLDILEEQTEDMEDRIFGTVERPAGDPQAQTAIFQLKKQLLRFRRAVVPLRDVLDVMQRRLVDVVTEPLEPYYRDVYDHVLRAADFLDGIRDILSSALDAHLAVVSNRLNVIMKHLTSYAAIILVPTLIAGIYGMNFHTIPELTWRYGYAYALALMFGSSAMLYVVFRRRDWL